jgi:hypothetical protein
MCVERTADREREIHTNALYGTDFRGRGLRGEGERPEGEEEAE